MSGKFTFVLNERQVSALLDALDGAVEQPPADSKFSRETFADLAELLDRRVAW